MSLTSLPITSVTQNSNGSWTFTWNAASSSSYGYTGYYRIVLWGSQIAQVASLTYTWAGTGYRTSPPPIEVANGSNLAASELYGPIMRFQWYGINQEAPPPSPTIPPPTRQPSQELFWDLPNYWPEWEVFRYRTITNEYIPTAPATHQPNQRSFDLVDFWSQWEVYKQESFVAWYSPPAPMAPATHQPNQRLYDLPSYWGLY